MIAPPTWTATQLDAARQDAEEHFVQARQEESLEQYAHLFDEYRVVVEELLAQTADLMQLEDHALDVLSDPRKREVFRYISGPPVSEDDLRVLVRSESLSPARLTGNSALLSRVVSFARDWHDRRRFPWLDQGWKPKRADRQAAVLATTALLTMRRVETLRRSEGKERQETRVEEALLEASLQKAPTREVATLAQAPGPGQFCRESVLGTRKADFIVGLWDSRTMALECKVSNSTTNSIKRLNNDAAVKAQAWLHDFGSRPIVPAAVLGGCYKLHNLEDAQDRGLALFWAHDLQPLIDFVLATKPGTPAKSASGKRPRSR